jgi:hypothetical protein
VLITVLIPQYAQLEWNPDAHGRCATLINPCGDGIEVDYCSYKVAIESQQVELVCG